MLEAVLAFGFGLLIGSFLNVCVYRLPRDLSVVRPRSYCPSCEQTIAWYDNVPLLSYAILRGHCRHCKAAIPVRYPLVELITGGLFFLYVLRMGPTLAAVKYCILGALLVGLLFADLEERILPDEFTLGGTLVGLALSLVVRVQDITAHAIFWLLKIDASPRVLSFAESLFGALLPAFFVWLGGYIY
jgi:leader peptidase (prepilin peptidase)/N-methyltransferase